MHLLARKKLEDALELGRIETAIDIREAPGLDRERLRNFSRFFFQRIQKIQKLAVFEALHVPMSERAVDWIAQQNHEFDLRIVIRDPLHRRLPVQITRRYLPDQKAAVD